MTVFLIVYFFNLFFPHSSAAQELKQGSSEFQNQTDLSLTFSRVSYLPSVDNVNGIYARALDQKIEEFIKNKPQWTFVPPPSLTSSVLPQALIKSPENVKAFSEHIKVDAFFISQVRKNPKFSQLSLHLFSAKTGQLVAFQRIEFSKDDMVSLEENFLKVAQIVTRRIPYEGLILSRMNNNRVTIDMGSAQGLSPGQELTCFKIINVQRHPKQKFILKTYKLVVGQIKVVQVEKYMSFADILSETETGVLGPGVKLTGSSTKKYSAPNWVPVEMSPEKLLGSKAHGRVFGENPKEWKDVGSPHFGYLGGSLFLGNFKNTFQFSDQTKSTYSSPYYPKIDIHGELWITPSWFLRATVTQGFGFTENPSGSFLNPYFSQYNMTGGYNFVLYPYLPKTQFFLSLGLNMYGVSFLKSPSSDSVPSVNYISLPIGLEITQFLDSRKSWSMGLQGYWHFVGDASESLNSSRSSENQIFQIIIHGEKKLTQRWSFNLGVEYLDFFSSFEKNSSVNLEVQTLDYTDLSLFTSVNYYF